MNDLPLVKPSEVKIKGFDKIERTFLLSKIPATVSMEIVVQYSKGLLPGDTYKLTEAMAFKIMQYVAIPNPVKDKPPLRLSSEELINNHCDFHTYAQLQRAMAQYNWGFFFKRRPLRFLAALQGNAAGVVYPNNNGFIASIVTAGKATLRELTTVYSLEDAFFLWECIAVERYSQYLAAKRGRQ